MGTVTDIRKQKTRDRFNVYVDGNYSFSLSGEEVVKSGVRKGTLLTHDEINSLTSGSRKQKLLERVYGYLGIRPRSVKEVKDYLTGKGASDEEKEEIMKKVSEMGFLNDEEFAKWWVDQRNEFRPRGARILKLELKRKGIADQIIEKVATRDSQSEGEKARRILTKKLKKYDKLEKKEAKKKASEFLLRQGFGWDTVKSVVLELIK